MTAFTVPSLYSRFDTLSYPLHAQRIHLCILNSIINVQQICTMRGWNENSSDSQSIKTRLMAVWEGLQQSADDDQDGQVRHFPFYL